MSDDPIAMRYSRRFQAAMVGEGALVGIAVGIVITLYRMSLSTAERVLRSIIASVQGNPLLVVGWFCVLAVLCLLVGLLVAWEPDTGGSGIPQVDAEVMGRMSASWHRVIVAKFAEGSLLAFGGLSLGREGPSVQLGGMAGKAVSQLFGKDRGEERLLVTCGAGAGMSAAFHAPLTGVLFAVEEIHREFTAPLVISVMTASIAADFLVSQVLGVQPVVRLSYTNELPHIIYPFALLLGVVCGLLGALHNRGFFWSQETLFAPLAKAHPAVRYAAPFAVAGVVAFVAPEFLCGGDAILEEVLNPRGLALGTIAFLLVGKYLFTGFCFGSGAPGGTLFPLVVMGALIGLGYAGILSQLGLLNSLYNNSFIVLGIAGLFASVVRAPVSAVVLCFELTGSLDALLSASAVSIVSYVVANFTKTEPFYEHLLGKLLGVTVKDQDVNEPSGRLLHTYHVAAGSLAEGMYVSEVPWPNGSLCVNITRADLSIIPKGSVELMALDEILVVMNEATADDTDIILRKLCEGRFRGERGSRLGKGSQGARDGAV